MAQRMEERCTDTSVHDDGYESMVSEETEDEFDDNQYGTMVNEFCAGNLLPRSRCLAAVG